MIDRIGQDLRCALRLLHQSPVVTLAVIITLALGIGATTAIFSLVNAWLLRPLPLKDAQQLVSVWRTAPQAPRDPAFFNLYHDYLIWASSNHTLQSLAATFEEPYALTGAGEPEQVHGAVATWNLFSTVGASAASGRLFLPEDVHEAPSCVISHALWTAHFHASPQIIGHAITLNGKLYRVLGVLPSRFSLRVLDRPFETAVWTLITSDDSRHSTTSSSPVAVIGRLKPGVTTRQAEADLEGMQKELDQVYKDYPPGIGILVAGLQEDNTRTVRSSLLLLLGAVAVLLVIACMNAGSLIVGQNSQRVGEFAVRVALGCSAPRLLQQLTIEILVLFAIGGGAGLLVATALLRIFVAYNPLGVLPAGGVGIDGTVLGIAVGAVFVTALLFGSLPAFRALRTADATPLRSRSATAGRGELRARMLFVAAEFALSVILLVTAGLLAFTFGRLSSEPLGFQTHDVFVTDVSLPYRTYPNVAAHSRFADELVRQLRTLAPVQAAGVALAWPFQVNGLDPVEIEGHPAAVEHMQQAAPFVVGPGYFDALGIPLLMGRNFNQHDGANTPLIAVISDQMAREFFPGQDPIGKRIRLHYSGEQQPSEPWVTVVGVVGTTSSLRYNQLQWDHYPALYTLLSQQRDSSGTVQSAAQRTDSRTLYLYIQANGLSAPRISEVVHGLDPNLPLGSVRSVGEIVGDLRSQPRLRALLSGSFGLITLVLAAVGVYGVMAQQVEQRRREIGIRMALGAVRANILVLVLRRALLLTGAGMIAGISAAVALTHVLRGLLYKTSELDPITFSAVITMLVFVALVAGYVPARRAAQFDPAITLRSE